MASEKLRADSSIRQAHGSGNPAFKIRYDLAEAKRLVKEAGYSPEKPLKTTFVIAQGGTGEQMLSLPMNEFLQQSFKEIGIEIDFKVVELEALYTYWRKGAKGDSMAGITANNIAYVTSDPLARHHPFSLIRAKARRWA